MGDAMEESRKYGEVITAGRQTRKRVGDVCRRFRVHPVCGVWRVLIAGWLRLSRAQRDLIVDESAAATTGEPTGMRLRRSDALAVKQIAAECSTTYSMTLDMLARVPDKLSEGVMTRLIRSARVPSDSQTPGAGWRRRYRAAPGLLCTTSGDAP
jgi:hypothetical protein